MANTAIELPPKGGFSFDLCRRNEMLVNKGVQPPSFRKTGTTIVGLVFQDGVILGADTRATEGPIVCDKNCEKIHYMAPNIYCCGAGTAADTEAVTDMVSSQLELHRYATGRESRVVTALTLLKSHLYSYQGHVSAALVLGGVDCTGPHLHTIYPHGSTDTLPFATMGSGSLAAMAMFESRYREGMTREEGIKLVCGAICAGIFNDLGSGSNVDVCVITKGQKEYLRNYELPNPRTYVSSNDYSSAERHTAPVLQTRRVALPSGERRDAHVKIILDLLELHRNTKGCSATADVRAKLQDVGAPHGWKDLISNEYVQQAHIRQLWEMADRNIYDVRNPMPLLSGRWSGRGWRSSEGLLKQIVNAPKQFLFLGIQDDKFEMTIDDPGNDGRYIARFGDNEYNALSPIRENMMRCHLAFHNRDAKVYMRLVNSNVLVGQAWWKAKHIFNIILVRE